MFCNSWHWHAENLLIRTRLLEFVCPCGILRDCVHNLMLDLRCTGICCMSNSQCNHYSYCAFLCTYRNVFVGVLLCNIHVVTLLYPFLFYSVYFLTFLSLFLLFSLFFLLISLFFYFFITFSFLIPSVFLSLSSHPVFPLHSYFIFFSLSLSYSVFNLFLCSLSHMYFLFFLSLSFSHCVSTFFISF